MQCSSLRPNEIHRFVWREISSESLVDYHITRLNFGVTASPFTANMAVKWNGIDLVNNTLKWPGSSISSSTQMMDLREQILYTKLETPKTVPRGISKEDFMLHKWKTSVPTALKYVSPHLLDEQVTHEIVDTNNFTED